MKRNGHKQIKSIKDLQPDSRNANAGTPRGQQMVEDSLRKHGAGRSILADKKGRIIAGNKTLMSASDINLPVRVVETDGHELVVVQRTDLDLDDPNARELAIADNRSSQVGLEWDAAILSQLKDEGVNLGSMFTEKELRQILAGLPNGNGDVPDAQIDKAAELQEKWGVKYGDLWEIGRHRLLCGDATSAEDVERLMDGKRAAVVVTSPPYNQNIDTFKPSGMQKESPSFVHRMAASYDDSKSELEYQAEQVEMLKTVALHLNPNGSIFYNHKIRYRDKRAVSPMEWLSQLPFCVRQEIIWDRGSSITMNARMLIPADERIYWLRVGDDFVFNDQIEIKSWSTVWRVAAKNDVAVSAAFATEIPLRCIRIASQKDDIVIEPYAGSGTTIAASELLERRCFAIEVKESHCAVILERLTAMGLSPKLIKDAK